MGNSYTRQSAADIVDGQTVFAAPLNAEFNALQNFADGNSGHTHDGTVGEGPKINLTTSIIGILPISNGGIGGINNLTAITDPSVTDDTNDGYSEGSLWINTTTDVLFVCVDSFGGAAKWQRFQDYDTGLQSISGLTTAADLMIYTTALDVYATTALTPFARTVLDDVDAVSVRTTLGLGSIATQNSASITITGGTITGITDLAIADGGTGASTAANARTNLGLGSMALQNSGSVSITGGTIAGATITGGSVTGITDLAIADGGTGASDAAGARTNLGLGSLSTASTISNSDWSGTDLAIINGGTGASDAATARTNLGLGNVNNTSDANKPVSTAQQTALDLKLNLSGGTMTGALSMQESSAPTTGVNIGAVYTKAVSGTTELFFRGESDGTEIQLTSGGKLRSLGVDQIWMDMIASRVHSTSYQNTTGRPIEVLIMGSSTGRDIEVSSDNATWIVVGKISAVAAGQSAFVVPNNWYYRVNGSTTISNWVELR